MAASGELVGFRYRGGTQSRPVALDRSLARLAAAQHGVVTRPQLVELGFSPRAITGRMARRGLLVLHRGVYGVGHGVLRPEGRWLAAVLAGGPGAVLSHRSAAALWDLRPATRPTIDVTAPRTRVGRPGIDLHLSRCLESHHRAERKRIPATTVARTLVDLAGVLETTGVERAWHRAEMLDLLDVDAVRDALSNGRGRRGAATLRALLAEHAPDHI